MGTKAAFRFKMKPEWKKAIKDGRKKVDVRINIQPYADVKKGDIICYHGLDVKVKRINAYPGLNDLLQVEGYKNVVPEAKDINEAIDALLPEVHQIERPHGILAFEIEPMLIEEVR